MTEKKEKKKPKRDLPEPITRMDIIQKRGQMVTVLYTDEERILPCFAIGWFFQLTIDTVRLKVTSTRFETYESLDILIDLVYGIEEYRD